MQTISNNAAYLRAQKGSGYQQPIMFVRANPNPSGPGKGRFYLLFITHSLCGTKQKKGQQYKLYLKILGSCQ